LQDFLRSVAMQVVTAAEETNMLAVWNDGHEALGIGIGERTTRRWIGLEQQGGATHAGERVREIIAIKPTAFDDGREDFGGELA
jgi:hypothetical protein